MMMDRVRELLGFKEAEAKPKGLDEQQIKAVAANVEMCDNLIRNATIMRDILIEVRDNPELSTLTPEKALTFILAKDEVLNVSSSYMAADILMGQHR